MAVFVTKDTAASITYCCRYSHGEINDMVRLTRRVVTASLGLSQTGRDASDVQKELGKRMTDKL